ncbi:MAG: YggS family pyridoxal phosphate-dependent enzyme [Verrucomicrobiota bacterium]
MRDLLDEEAIRRNLEAVEEGMNRAAGKAGRAVGDITLLAVTKTWPTEVLERAFALGLRDFGENRVQELEEKVPALSEEIRWHLIGPLQKNKVRKVIPLAGTIHSVDRLSLAERMSRIAGEEGLTRDVFWQVNLAGETQKAGFSTEELRQLAGQLWEMPNLNPQGLMIIPPFDPDPEAARASFAGLREFRDELEGELGERLPELSMGMSHDYAVAIEEGATQVRVGSALFGKRG